MSHSGVHRDGITRLFGLLLLCQASIFCVAVTLFSKLPQPHSLIPTASALDMPILDESSLGKLVVSGDRSEPSTERSIEYLVKKRDTLASIWSKNGAPSAGAVRAAEAFRQAGISASSLKAGQSLTLTLSLDGDITNLRKRFEDGRMLSLAGNSVEGYEVDVLQPDVAEQERSVSGTILSSFSNSAREYSIPYSVVDEFVDLFSSRVEFRRTLQPGDTFSVTYIERKCKRSNSNLEPGRITNASLYTGGKLMVAIGYASRDGEMRYFDEDGKKLGSYFLRYPLTYTRISSAFSWARFHPVLQRNRPHLGVDFAAPLGAPVRTVADGVVVEAGFRGDAGNMIAIRHGTRWMTSYLHLQRIASGIKKGVRVSRGQVIGAVGSTGISTGTHLHFELHDNGKYVDPMRAELPRMDEGISPIPQSYLIAQLEAIRRRHESVAVAAVDNGRRRL